MILKRFYLFIFIYFNIIYSENIVMQNYIKEFFNKPNKISYKNIANYVNSNTDNNTKLLINDENFQN